MSRFHSYILSATKIIETYDGGKPLMYHLKSFFSAEKKYGSRDRKMIASLCYSFFRIGQALKNASTEERILAGLFLSETKNNEILALLRPLLNEQVFLPVMDKLFLLGIRPGDIFPFTEQLADEIVKEQFVLSFLKQPDLYLRMRPGKEKQVTDILNETVIPFEKLEDDCLRVSNNTSLETVLKINKQVVIQDSNSQLVLNFLKANPGFFAGKGKVNAWDCCAASGGKSILLYDILKGQVRLTVSDIRENILLNLGKRFQEAGININRKFTTDLSKTTSLPAADFFSLIICDAPCTGSGTWGRTPEQLFYFDEHLIKDYSEKQKKIVSNIIPHIEAGGLLFYITCSVFKKENEEVVDFIKEKFHLQLMQMEYLKGYDKKADTMFVAVFSHHSDLVKMSAM
ncbi:MAG: Fmu (Sun) domain-containing protein [Ferruginibacter sp.]